MKLKSMLILLCTFVVLFGFGLAFARSVPAAQAAPPNSPQMGSSNYAMDWSAVGRISGSITTSTNYRINATIGQMAASTGSVSANYRVCTGFQCVLDAIRVYLPLITR